MSAPKPVDLIPVPVCALVLSFVAPAWADDYGPVVLPFVIGLYATGAIGGIIAGGLRARPFRGYFATVAGFFAVEAIFLAVLALWQGAEGSLYLLPFALLVAWGGIVPFTTAFFLVYALVLVLRGCLGSRKRS